MSWKLLVYTPMGGPHVSGSQIAVYGPEAPGGIVEGFQWSCSPHGDCLQMEFTAVPRMVNIPPRAIVQLLIDDVPAFYGFVSRSWPVTTGRAERYVVLGMSQLLRQRYANVVSTSTQDISQLVHAVMQFRHPSIDYSGPPPNTGYTLTTFKAPWVDIATILKDLSGAAGGVPYGVRADGSFFFQQFTTTTAVQYNSSNTRYLPVEGSEVVDVVRLLHPESGFLFTYDSGLGFGSERTVVVPQMRDYMNRVPGTFRAIDTVTDLYDTPTTLNPAWLHDDNQTTGHIVFNNLQPGFMCRQTLGVRGIDFLFTPSPGMAIVWRVQANLVPLDAPNYPQSQSLGIRLSYNLQSINQQIDFGAVPGHATIPSGVSPSQTAFLTLGGRTFDSCTTYRFAVYQFAVYTPSTILTQLAASLVQPPYLTPSEVHIPGYTPPKTNITLLDTPSGNVDGPVSRWEYVYTVHDGIASIAKIGHPGTTGEAEAIKILATQISAEGDTRLRW